MSSRIASTNTTFNPFDPEFRANPYPGCIVMATHGRKGMDRFLLGSIAERVLRAPWPVRTIRPELQTTTAQDS